MDHHNTNKQKMKTASSTSTSAATLFKDPVELNITDFDEEQVAFLQSTLNYKNNVHKVLRYTLFPIGVILLATSLALGIVAWVFTMKYATTLKDGYIGWTEMETNEHLPLYAASVVLQFIVLLSSLVIFALSFAAMRHEKLNSPLLNRTKLFFKRFTSLILTVLLLGILIYFLVTSYMVSYSLQKFWVLTRYRCTAEELTCKRVELSYKLFSSSFYISTVATIGLVMLSTSVLSHTGSLKLNYKQQITTSVP